MDLVLKMCRLCLESVEPAAVVVLNEAEHLVESIYQLTTIEVITDPASRVFMCDQCQNRLDVAIQFRAMCLQNDETFRKMHALHANSLVSKKTEQFNSSSEFIECKIEDESENSEIFKIQQLEETVIEEEVQASPKPGKRNPTTTRKKYKPKTKHKASPPEKVQCQTCGAFVHPTHLPKHQQIHEKDRPMFACERCPKKYTEQRKLREHVTIVHEGHLEHTCDRCGKTFHRWETLRQHYLGEHTDLKKYECKICGEKFARSANRNYHHTMYHTVAKPFACSLCDKSFKRSCDLTIHIRTHTGEKPFKCDICGKAFAKSYNVVIHKKSHKSVEMRKAIKLKTEDS